MVWEGKGLPPSGFGSPLVLGGAVLLANKSGVLSSVQLEDGALQWKTPLAMKGQWASPITDGKHVWFFGKNGTTSVVKWTAAGAEEIAVNTLVDPGEILGAAAVDGMFVLRAPGHVYGIFGQGKK
jgi:hypothetical protein